jgi:hypothetical protein
LGNNLSVVGLLCLETQPEIDKHRMAIYRLEAKIIGRKAKDDVGRVIAGKQVSVVAKAAYRSGQRLRDEKRNIAFDYRARSQEVVYTEIIAPAGAPAWLQPEADRRRGRDQREKLWNEIEAVEKRSDSQLAREFTIALPIELEREAQIEAVRNWCREELVTQGFVVDLAVHKSKDGQNPHAHVLCTMRPVNDDGFGKKPDMAGKFNGRAKVGMGAKSDLVDWRESWASAENKALAAAGLEARVDHRSLADQGIDRTPEPKIGVAACAMKRRGMLDDPFRMRFVRQLRVNNQIRAALRQIERFGEVLQEGIDPIWWERAHAAGGQLYNLGVEFLKDESSGGDWRNYVKERLERDGQTRDGPEIDR